MNDQALYRMHHVTRQLILWSNRLLAGVVIIGSLFGVLLFGVLQLVSFPEKVLHTHSFSLNYLEHENIASDSPSQDEIHRDPDWDGALAGASVGLTLGHSVPLIGPFIGPAFGALIGYKMDRRL